MAAVEFNDADHFGLFTTSATLTSQTGKMVRQSELVLAALRAQGVFDTMVDSTTAPATDKLWLDKNFDPAILKIWDSTGSAWVGVTFDRLFDRAVTTIKVAELAVTSSTANVITVSEPDDFYDGLLYVVTPTMTNTGDTSITVAGVGTYAVKYQDGSQVEAGEMVAGSLKVLFYYESTFYAVFGTAELVAATNAAIAAKEAAEEAEDGADDERAAAELAASNSFRYSINADHSADQAALSASASGNVVIYDTYSDAAAAASGSLANNRIVEVIADETKNGQRTRYLNSNKSLVYKITLYNAKPEIFGTAAEMPLTFVPTGITALRVNGYSAAGDGGAALYKKVETEPSHDEWFTSADGAIWELASFKQPATAAVPRTLQDKMERDLAVSAYDFTDATDSGFQMAINRAIEATASRGGGEVIVPNLGEEYELTGAVDIEATVLLRGVGFPVLKLANGVNTDVVKTTDFYTLTGTDNGSATETPGNFGLIDIILDGNSANQSPSDADECNGLALYGWRYLLRNVYAKNIAGNGIRTEWADGAPPFGMECSIENLKIDTCGRHGAWLQGPHDSNYNHIIVIDASQEADGTYDGICVEGSGNGRFYNVHPWCRSTTTTLMRFAFSGGNCEVLNSHLEGGRRQAWLRGRTWMKNVLFYSPRSNDAQIIVDGDSNQIAGRFSSNALYKRPKVLEFGANVAAGLNDIRLNVGLDSTGPSNPIVTFTNDVGGNVVELQTAGGDVSNMVAGTRHVGTELKIIQSYAAKYHIHVTPDNGLTVGYSGWGAQSSRYGTGAGQFQVSWNGNYVSQTGTYEQDDASVGSCAIIGRSGSISFIADPAGTTTPNIRGELTSAGTWRLGGIGGTEKFTVSPIGVGFYGAAAQAKPTITGATDGNAALTDLVSKLAVLGLITDSTT